MHAVTLACIAVLACAFVAQFAAAQYAKKRKPDSGPRAVGLLKIDAKGRAELIAVVIRIDGKFYDAGAYKADPVPMALQPDTVYEGLKSGASQGIFTTSGAMRGLDGWFADGKWRTNAQIEAAKAKAKAESEKKAQKASQDPVNSGPPRLRRPGDAPPPSSSTTPSDANKTPSSSTTPSEANKTPPAAPPAAGSANPPTSSSSSTSPAKDSSAKDSSAKDSAAKAPAQEDSAKSDAGRPVMRRQEQSETSHEQTTSDSGRPVLRHQEPSETAHEQTKIAPEEAKGPFQWIPAISDAGGPEARPYTYDMKPDEEATLTKKVMAMAGQEVNARAASLGRGTEPETGAKPKSKASDKPALSKAEGNVRPTQEPQFQDVQVRTFDLSNTNEPVLVLTANATVPSQPNLVFMIALVAREDIYGDLHKVSAKVTDNQHLDVLPKYEFIDAVDADGDGRAELLFRLTSDAGSAYAIYAVIGDRLWPLFEGKPGT